MIQSGPTPGDSPAQALASLADSHGGRLLALGRRFCGDPGAAEDLVQEVLLAAYRGWDSFDGRSDVSTWLYTIAARACQRMQRLRSGQPAKEESLDVVSPFGETRMALLASEDDGPLDQMLLGEAKAQLEVAIAGLPETFRMPLVLHSVAGFRISEVAQVLGVKEATVKTRLHRARMALRAVLIEVVPTIDAVPPIYDRQVCLDLLAAKQEALDRGVSFEFPNGLICERCASVFGTLDLADEICGGLAEGELPGELRARILDAAD